MTRQAIPEVQASATPRPPPVEVQKPDEGVWQAWIEKNERLDKMRFARRVKRIAIFVLILAVVVLVRFMR
jgi:hypothetical protein